MALLLTNYTSALKEILLPYIRNNFPKQTILLDQMKRNAGVNVINDEFIAPIYTGRHGGVTNLANDGNNINAASGRSTSRGTVAPKIVTGALDISKLAIDASQGNTLAVENALVAQTRTLADDFARHVNRQLYSDGVGVVSQVLGSVSGTEFSVMRPDSGLDDTRSIDWYGSVNGDIDPIKYLAAGQILGIGTGGAGDGTVSALTGTSVQLTGATASVGSDSVYIQDASLGAPGTTEIQGIRAALSSTTGTSTYAGLARSTTGWTPQFGSVSEALALSRMEKTYLNATEYASLSDQFVILVNKTLFQKYGDLLTAMRREVNKTDLLGGWTGLEFSAGVKRIGVFLDFDVPDGEVVFSNLDTWTICQVSDMDWLEDPNNGGGLLRLDNTIKYQAAMVWFVNAICLAPAANGRLTQKTA